MPLPNPVISAFFLEASVGQRFCLLHQPPTGQAALGQVIYVHPFAEELNAARRMAALQARAFAQAGFVVLQMDLLGCGDSTGDFADASWDTWLQDLALAQRWMHQHWPGQLWWWGLRAGSLLAAQACRANTVPAHLLLWQPVLLGKQHLNQFLRLQMAGDIARGEPSRGTAPLAQLLAQGESVEVAGYRVSGALSQGMAQADMDGLPAGSQIICLELGSPTDDGGGLSPALSGQIQRWQHAGCTGTALLAEGAAFWQMQECPDSDAWVHTSLKALQVASAKGLP